MPYSSLPSPFGKGKGDYGQSSLPWIKSCLHSQRVPDKFFLDSENAPPAFGDAHSHPQDWGLDVKRRWQRETYAASKRVYRRPPRLYLVKNPAQNDHSRRKFHIACWNG